MSLKDSDLFKAKITARAQEQQNVYKFELKYNILPKKNAVAMVWFTFITVSVL